MKAAKINPDFADGELLSKADVTPYEIEENEKKSVNRHKMMISILLSHLRKEGRYPLRDKG
ncbi:hypothetical protein [Streptococcus chenjunshii]|nr:hypothetical protein [Streptococcus chenjunshii]